MPEPPKRPPLRNMAKWQLLRRSKRPVKAVKADYAPETEGMTPEGDWRPERRKLQPWATDRLKNAKPGQIVAFGQPSQLFITKGSDKRKKPRKK